MNSFFLYFLTFNSCLISEKENLLCLPFEITTEKNTNNIIKNLLNSHIYTTLNLTSNLLKFNIQNAYYSFSISSEKNSSKSIETTEFSSVLKTNKKNFTINNKNYSLKFLETNFKKNIIGLSHSSYDDFSLEFNFMRNLNKNVFYFNFFNRSLNFFNCFYYKKFNVNELISFPIFFINFHYLKN